jgi:hypothetical protein
VISVRPDVDSDFPYAFRIERDGSLYASYEEHSDFEAQRNRGNARDVEIWLEAAATPSSRLHEVIGELNGVIGVKPTTLIIPKLL